MCYKKGPLSIKTMSKTLGFLLFALNSYSIDIRHLYLFLFNFWLPRMFIFDLPSLHIQLNAWETYLLDVQVLAATAIDTATPS